MSDTALKLITCIVERGKANQVVKAVLGLNITGATIFYARGTGVRQKLGFLSRIFLNPEKEVIMTVVPAATADEVFDRIIDVGRLNEPGRGFAYIQNVERTAGMSGK